MGSSGMKRKGRKHLAKAGTRPAMEQELHDRRELAVHPFSSDPLGRRGTSYGVAAIIVVVVVLIGVFALIIAT